MISFKTKYLTLLSCVEMLINEMERMHNPTEDDVKWVIDYLKYISTVTNKFDEV